ncbi:MAG: M24 family metallopeptidase [Pseudomonadota bacterium]
MTQVFLSFSKEEYADRLGRVRKAMDRDGVEVIVCTDPSNMAWLTGYDGWSFYTPQAVIVGPTGEPLIWTRAMDAPGALKTCYIGADSVIAYPDHYVMNPPLHAFDHLADMLADRSWATLRIAVEMENYYYSARAHAVFSKALGKELLDCTNLVNWCRAVKSETELLYMRRAGHIVERMHARVFEIFEPGRRKNDIVAEIYHTGITGGELDGVSFGGDYPAIAPMLPTGDEAAAAHLTWNDRPIPAGTGTFFEIAGCHRRYHAPLCRTIWLGDPPKDVAKAEEAAVEGINAGIEVARAGNTAGDVARAFYAALARHGIKKEGRCGYPIGLSYPPDWGERTFSIRLDDETVLKENMTFHFMPAIWMEDWGLEITEPLIIRADAPAEPLANVERKLFVKR